MPLIFKLVGFVINKKYYQIKDSFHGDINLDCIQSLFITWGLTNEESQEVKFIIDSEQIKDPDKIYHIDQDKTHNIFVFVFNQDIRQKLQDIFITHGDDISSLNDEEINQPITKLDDEELFLTREMIDIMNEKTLLIFSDPDFTTLLSIYKRKPELFNILSNYIQNNDVTDNIISDKTIDQLSDEETEYYTNLSIKIMNLDFDIPQNLIIEKLIRFSGHLNLTIRSLLV
jgi:hypothetical protein